MSATPADPPPWTLAPGEAIVRRTLHDVYGGSRKGGTIPSRTSPNIFLFLDKKVGRATVTTTDGLATASTTPATVRPGIRSSGEATSPSITTLVPARRCASFAECEGQ